MLRDLSKLANHVSQKVLSTNPSEIVGNENIYCYVRAINDLVHQLILVEIPMMKEHIKKG